MFFFSYVAPFFRVAILKFEEYSNFYENLPGEYDEVYESTFYSFTSLFTGEKYKVFVVVETIAGDSASSSIIFFTLSGLLLNFNSSRGSSSTKNSNLYYCIMLDL